MVSTKDLTVIQFVAIEATLVYRAEAIECAHVPLSRHRSPSRQARLEELNEIQHLSSLCLGKRAQFLENLFGRSHGRPTRKLVAGVGFEPTTFGL